MKMEKKNFRPEFPVEYYVIFFPLTKFESPTLNVAPRRGVQTTNAT